MFTPQHSAGEWCYQPLVHYPFQAFSNRDRILTFVSTCTIFTCNQVFPSLGFISECPYDNVTIFKRWEPGSQQRANQLEERFVLHALLNQIPLSFEGTGFVDIGLTRLLWLGLLIETSTRFLTRFTFLSKKNPFLKKKRKWADCLFVTMIFSSLLSY